MTTLEIWLITTLSIVWLCGGYFTYVTYISMGMMPPRKSTALVVYIVWPVATLWAMFSGRKRRGQA